MHKTRLELWLDFYKAALMGYCAKPFDVGMQGPGGVDDLAADQADFAMARYDALEAKVMLWGSGTQVRR